MSKNAIKIPPASHQILCPMWTSGTVPWYPMYLSHQYTQSYVSVQSHLPHVGQVGQSYGILSVPPTQSYVSILSHLSHVGQVGQSYGILSVPPTHSILCVRPIPPVPCRTSGTVVWNPICPTNTLNPMCPSYPTCPM